MICVGASLLVCCGSGRRDWRISACEGETAATCRLDRVLVDSQSRTFLVSQPPGGRCPDGPLPIVFAWHGSGGNGAQLRSYLGLDEVVAGHAVVVYPDGLPRSETGGFTGWNRDPDGDDLHFFDAMLEALGREPCLDRTRVFSVGHSRGGRFVEVLACQRAEAHRALAMIAAGAWNVASCPGRAPLWMAHGRDDSTVGFWQGKLLRGAWADRNGCDEVSFFDGFPTGRCTSLPGCSPETPVVWCPYEGSPWDGHGVPDFAPAAVWSFFLEPGRTRPAAGSGSRAGATPAGG